MQSQTLDHASTYQAICFLDQAIRKVKVPERTSLVCQECLKSPKINLKDNQGYFDLQKLLKPGSTCGFGHQLDEVQEQMFSGVSRDFEEYDCNPHAETSILGDTMRIGCSYEGVRVRARVAPFELL